MATRSSVVILLTNQAYEKGLEYMEKQLVPDKDNLLKDPSDVHILPSSGHVILFFTDVKWYSTHTDVGNIMSFLNALEFDDDYRFVKIDDDGYTEEYGDNEDYSIYAYTSLSMPDLSKSIKLDPSKYYIFINLEVHDE